jgi:hypothetical protein
MEIAAVRDFSKILKQASAVSYFACCPVFSAQIPENYIELNAYSVSPVTLKVRFNS